MLLANLLKIYEKYEEEKIGVARLKPTRYENSKGNRIGSSLFYILELYTNGVKWINS